MEFRFGVGGWALILRANSFMPAAGDPSRERARDRTNTLGELALVGERKMCAANISTFNAIKTAQTFLKYIQYKQVWNTIIEPCLKF